jgi:hypothetical protein
VTLISPDTFEFITVTSAPRIIRIVDEGPRHVPTSSGPPARDPRYKSS